MNEVQAYFELMKRELSTVKPDEIVEARKVSGTDGDRYLFVVKRHENGDGV